jgi:hypothetical protein
MNFGIRITQNLYINRNCEHDKYLDQRITMPVIPQSTVVKLLIAAPTPDAGFFPISKASRDQPRTEVSFMLGVIELQTSPLSTSCCIPLQTPLAYDSLGTTIVQREWLQHQVGI